MKKQKRADKAQTKGTQRARQNDSLNNSYFDNYANNNSDEETEEGRQRADKVSTEEQISEVAGKAYVGTKKGVKSLLEKGKAFGMKVMKNRSLDRDFLKNKFNSESEEYQNDFLKKNKNLSRNEMFSELEKIYGKRQETKPTTLVS